MATAVQISGNPSTGKSHSAKGLSERYPNGVYYINADGKPLAWSEGWDHFSEEKKNYFETSHVPTIMKILSGISTSRPEIKVAIVDTINTCMSDKEMADSKKSGYDKWKDFAKEIYDLYALVPKLRKDLIVIFMAHIEPYEADGETYYRTKTGGQKLTKLNLNSKLAYNLYTKVERTGQHAEYTFITQSDGRNEARSVAGVLPYEMPNDLGEVVHLIRTKQLKLEDTSNTSNNQNQ